MNTPPFYGMVSNHEIKFLGNVTLRNPLDAWMVQQIMWDTKPDFLIETGTFRGGSAIYYGSIFDLMGSGKVISIDSKPESTPDHPRVEYMLGNSINDDILRQVKEQIGGRSCMVILDSDHSYDHVKRELEVYSPLVTVGNYLIIEDGNPCETVVTACDEFVAAHPEFERRDDWDKAFYEISFNYRGWLRRIR